MSVATFLLVLVGGPIAVETLSHGRSLGKLACGLRVVRDDGGPIRFRHALVRGAMGVVEILMTFGVVACIASLVSARGRRLGDVFAGTLVVRERVPAARADAVPPPPPWLAGRFAGLDLSAVPDGLWLAIRQYLTRMQTAGSAGGLGDGGAAGRRSGGAYGGSGAARACRLPRIWRRWCSERQARDARRAFGGRRRGRRGAERRRPGAAAGGRGPCRRSRARVPSRRGGSRRSPRSERPAARPSIAWARRTVRPLGPAAAADVRSPRRGTPVDEARPPSAYAGSLPPASCRPVGSGEGRGRGLEVLELDAGGREDHVAGDVDRVLLTRVQGADLVFVHGQGAVVSGVCFAVQQGPGLVDGAGGEDRVGEGDEADAGGGGAGGEAQQAGGGDEEGGGGAGEGVGGDVAFGGMGRRWGRCGPR